MVIILRFTINAKKGAARSVFSFSAAKAFAEAFATFEHAPKFVVSFAFAFSFSASELAISFSFAFALAVVALAFVLTFAFSFAFTIG